MTKAIAYLILFLVIIGTFGYFGWGIYASIYEIPTNSPTGKYSLIIGKGDTLNTISQRLATDRVIGSDQSLLVQNQFMGINGLQTGTFVIEVPAKPKQILDQIKTQNDLKAKEIASAPKLPTVNITFKEGITADQVFDQLDKAGVTTRAELELLATKPGSFSLRDYPFLPTALDCEYGNYKTCAKYYLEGYLYPDTYTFFKPQSAEQVLVKFLNNFNTKAWSKIKDNLKDKDFGKAVIMASVLERETGRTAGVTAANASELSSERFTIAQIFYNRLEAGIPWQSDITAEYGTGRRLCQQTFKIENCLLLDSPEVQSKYNTYNVADYPIAPVTSPQLENIRAALNPTNNNFIFFISDITGKTYFAENENGHFANIAKISQINAKLQN